MNLHKHARLNDVNAVAKDVALGADINERDQFGSAPLHYALSESSYEVAIFLLDHNADVGCRDGDGKTPLHYTIEYNHLDLAAKIVERDSSTINVPDNDGNTPLWTAIFNAGTDFQFVELLLRKGASTTVKNNFGRSPFDLAEKLGDAQLIELVSKARA
tara:strand:+ start:10136 stop:10612 length:477 start_codon:yes stop_codon:yes gene_type:complete